MKILKKIMLGMLFLFGLTAMSSNNSGDSLLAPKGAVIEIRQACELIFTSCDGLYPNDYYGFDACMTRGGC